MSENELTKIIEDIEDALLDSKSVLVLENDLRLLIRAARENESMRPRLAEKLTENPSENERELTAEVLEKIGRAWVFMQEEPKAGQDGDDVREAQWLIDCHIPALLQAAREHESMRDQLAATIGENLSMERRLVALGEERDALREENASLSRQLAEATARAERAEDLLAKIKTFVQYGEVDSRPEEDRSKVAYVEYILRAPEPPTASGNFEVASRRNETGEASQSVGGGAANAGRDYAWRAGETAILIQGAITMIVEIQKHLNLLGLKVEDRATGFKGVVTAISFDLYGCIQAVVHPGMKKDKQGLLDSLWFDVNRLKVLDPIPVMERPDFGFGPVAEGKKGPSEKPRSMKA